MKGETCEISSCWSSILVRLYALLKKSSVRFVAPFLAEGAGDSSSGSACIVVPLLRSLPTGIRLKTVLPNHAPLLRVWMGHKPFQCSAVITASYVQR